MRRLLLVLATAVALLVGGCSSSAAPDPYQVAHRAMNAPWTQAQVDVGGTFKSGTESFTLAHGSLRVVVDSTAGKGLFHLAIPTSALGADAAALQQFGVSGSSLDFDALYDGQALYAKSPLLKVLIQLLMANSGELPQGDLAGWLRLGSATELSALAGSGAAAAPTPAGSLDVAGVRKTLNDAGLTLAFVGTEKRYGADADRVSVAVDTEKLLQSPAFDSANQGQVRQLRDAAKGGTVKAEFWADHATGRLIEMDIHVTMTGATATSADVAITLTQPAAGTSFAAPSGAVDLPATKLLGQALQMFGQSIGQ